MEEEKQSNEVQQITIEEREALCVKKQEELNALKLDLEEREARIAPYNGFIQIKKDNEALLQRIQDAQEKLSADQRAWATQVQGDKGQIDQDRILAHREAENNQNDRKNIEVLVMTRVREILRQYGQAELADKI